MAYIYILKLEEEKYYVGRSINVEKRLEQHFEKQASAWTRKYPVLDILEKIESSDEFDEMKYTLRMMGKFGIDNVRGGPFCEISFDPQKREFINSLLSFCSLRCRHCYSKEHFTEKCPMMRKKIIIIDEE